MTNEDINVTDSRDTFQDELTLGVDKLVYRIRESAVKYLLVCIPI